MNLQIDKLYNDLTYILGESDLPVGVVYFILKNITKDIEALYQQQVFKEQQSQSEENNEDNDTSIGQE